MQTNEDKDKFVEIDIPEEVRKALENYQPEGGIYASQSPFTSDILRKHSVGSKENKIFDKDKKYWEFFEALSKKFKIKGEITFIELGELTDEEIYTLVKILREELSFCEKEFPLVFNRYPFFKEEFPAPVPKEELDNRLKEFNEEHERFSELLFKKEAFYFPFIRFLLDLAVTPLKLSILDKIIPIDNRFKIWFGDDAEKILEVIGKPKQDMLYSFWAYNQKLGKEYSPNEIFDETYRKYQARSIALDHAIDKAIWFIYFDFESKKEINFTDYFQKEFEFWVDTFRVDFIEKRPIQFKLALRDLRDLKDGDILSRLYRQLDYKEPELTSAKKNKLICKFIFAVKKECGEDKLKQGLLSLAICDLEEIKRTIGIIDNKVSRIFYSILKDHPATLDHYDIKQIAFSHAIKAVFDFDEKITKGHFYGFFYKRVYWKSRTDVRRILRIDKRNIDYGKFRYQDEEGEEVGSEDAILSRISLFNDAIMQAKTAIDMRDLSDFIARLLDKGDWTPREKNVALCAIKYKNLSPEDKNKQTSAELKISVANVKNTLKIIRKKLKGILKAKYSLNIANFL